MLPTKSFKAPLIVAKEGDVEEAGIKETPAGGPISLSPNNSNMVMCGSDDKALAILNDSGIWLRMNAEEMVSLESLCEVLNTSGHRKVKIGLQAIRALIERNKGEHS